MPVDVVDGSTSTCKETSIVKESLHNTESLSRTQTDQVSIPVVEEEEEIDSEAQQDRISGWRDVWEAIKLVS